MKRVQMPKIREMIKNVGAILFVTALFFAFAGVYQYPPDQKDINRGNFEGEMSAKFTRGVTNTFFGWTEVVATPVNMSQDIRRGPFSIFFLGLPYGIIRAVGRTVVGAYEVSTFYAPQKPIFNALEGEVM